MTFLLFTALLFHQLQTKSQFSDYFVSITDYNTSDISNVRVSIGEEQYYLHDCVFTNIECPNNHGGSFFMFSKEESNVCIEKCAFSNCQTSKKDKWGGALFIATSGGVVLSKVCGFRCSTQSSDAGYDQFAHLRSGHEKQINELLHTSVSECSYQPYGVRYCPLSMWNGLQNLNGLNSSFNSPSHIAGIALRTTNQSTITECTFSHNIARHSRCIELKYSQLYQITRTNVLYNDYMERFGGIIDATMTNAVFDNCVFIHNARNLDTLFVYTFHANVTFSDCVIDRYNMKGHGILFTGRKKSGIPFKYEHFSSAFCA